jgi:hypothetical protein
MLAPKLVLLSLCLLQVCQAAEPLSNHNEEHAAIQAASNRLYDQGCERVNTTRTGAFTMWPAGKDFTIIGKVFTVSCTKWKVQEPPPAQYIELTWSKPTTRVDGSLLRDEDIKGYELEHIPRVVTLANVTSHTVEAVEGNNIFRIRTVAEKAGPWSDYMTVTVE